MAKTVLTMRVRFAWWVTPYLAGVRLCCMLTGREPDYQRVARAVNLGMRITAE
jgi:hypothetical protein